MYSYICGRRALEGVRQRCQVDKLNGHIGENNKKQQEHPVDRLLQELFGFTDEALLNEFEEAQKQLDRENGSGCTPPPDEFERIWERIMGEEEEEASRPEPVLLKRPPEKKRGRVIRLPLCRRRIAAVGLLAALFVGSGCMVAMGTKSYFFQTRVVDGSGNEIVYNNDDNLAAENEEEKAYAEIEDQLGVKSLRLGYIPEEMRFSQLKLREQYTKLEFLYGEHLFYIIQAENDTATSFDYESDMQKTETSVYNRWIDSEITIREEQTEEGIRYEALFARGRVYYRIVGVMEESEFNRMVEELHF